MANNGAFHIYERRAKGSRWQMADKAHTPEEAKRMAHNMISSTGFFDQQARVKNAITGKWIRNSLVTRETIEAEGGAS